MRVALLAEHLLLRGHTVVWWGSAFDHLSKRWIYENDCQTQTDTGLRIIALKGLRYHKNLSLARFIGLRIIARKFRKLAPSIDLPDIILASTPSYDLAYEAVSFAKMNKIPVVVDIRDEWPESFIKHTFVNRFPLFLQKCIRLILHRDFHMIKMAMQDADSLTSMMGSLLEWGLQYAERPNTWKDKVFYLGFQKVAIIEHQQNKISKLIERIQDKFIVTFIGTFGVSNHPLMVLDCANRVSDNNIYFVMAGAGDLLEIAKKRARDLKLKNITFPGWLSHAEIVLLLQHTHVGLAPTSGFRDGFPNKIFTYFSEGIPIISAWQGELNSMIDKYGIGYNCLPNDAEGMASHIKALHDNREYYQLMARNVKQLFHEMFDADKIYEEFASHIEAVQHNIQPRNDRGEIA